MVTPTQSFTFLAIPFFIIAGNVMNATGITDRLVRFAKTCTGHMAGGLAQISIMLSALMGGISGSAIADASMEARFLGPSMLEGGYSKGFTAAVLCYGGIITATIPPSLGFIVYGFVGDVPIGRLFAGGIIPGIIMTFVLMIPTHFISKRRGYKTENAVPPTLAGVLTSAKDSFWALMFPVILLIGIRFGFFTPSEAGAFAIVYAIIVGVLIYKELTLKKLLSVMDNSVTDTGVILLIVSMAGIFGFISAYDGVPAQVGKFLTGISTNKYVLFYIIIAFAFIAGCLMENTIIILIFTPIFLPIMKSVGVDPVHFGVVFMTVVTMGCMTPPVGSGMYSVCNILECNPVDYIREGNPYIIAIMIEVAVLAALPEIVLCVPNLIFGK
jgi:tripartite ATP-independent transporter DctM subunit